MIETKKFQMEADIERVLNELLDLIGQSDIIRDYQQIEKQAKEHPALLALAEKIKVEQKQAVKFAHYGKPVAEQEAIKKADALMQEFEEHPLVVTYRQKLILANDLLQHVTNLLEAEVNEHIELSYQDALNVMKEEK